MSAESACTSHRASRTWPLIIVSLILANAATVGLTVYFAASDKTFGVEPDYYNKAVQWDRQAREQDRAAQLGWHVDLELNAPQIVGGQPVLTVHLYGSCPTANIPMEINDAVIRVEAFAQARSSQRVHADLLGTGNGTYQAPLAVGRTGLWELRLRIQHAGEAASLTRTLLVTRNQGADHD